MRNHIRDARQNKKTRCHRWIRGLLKLRLEPLPKILEAVTGDWESAERRWIAELRAQGFELLNHTDGGQGPTGRKCSPESIEKTRRAHLGTRRSPEAKARMRAAWTPERKAAHIARQRGKTISEEQRRRCSELMRGRKRDPAVVEAVAAKLRGRKHTLERCIKAGLGVKRAWTPDRRAAQAARMSMWRRTGKFECEPR